MSKMTLEQAVDQIEHQVLKHAPDWAKTLIYTSRTWYFSSDTHWTPRGHKAIWSSEFGDFIASGKPQMRNDRISIFVDLAQAHVINLKDWFTEYSYYKELGSDHWINLREFRSTNLSSGRYQVMTPFRKAFLEGRVSELLTYDDHQISEK